MRSPTMRMRTKRTFQAVSGSFCTHIAMSGVKTTLEWIKIANVPNGRLCTARAELSIIMVDRQPHRAVNA